MFNYPVDLQHGAGPLLALLPEPDAAALAETAVALANADGGAILLGVGTESPAADAISAWLDAARRLIRPSDVFGPCETLRTPDGPRLLIRVRRANTVHAMDDGRVFLRAGDHNRLLNGREIRDLLSLRTVGDFDGDPVPGASLDDLDETQVRAFARARVQHMGARWPGTFADLLAACGAIDGPRVTVAGMLLFGRDPQHWLPHSHARFRHFSTPGGSGIAPAHDITVNGALVPVLERLIALVGEHMRSRTIDGAHAPDFDRALVRPVLTNALIHRDYRLRHGGITVDLYPDELVITSPGGPPPVLSWDAATGLPCERFTINPRLAWTLFQWGCTGQGDGLRRVRDGLAVHRLRLRFETPADRFTVRLPAARTVSGAARPAPDHDDKDAALNPRQAHALRHVAAQGSITPREYYALSKNALRRDALQRELDDLVTQGRLLKIDSRTGAYYIAP